MMPFHSELVSILIFALGLLSVSANAQFIVHDAAGVVEFEILGDIDTPDSALGHLGTGAGEVLLPPTRPERPGVVDPLTHIDVQDTIELYPGQTLVGQRNTTLRLTGDNEEIIDRPVVRFVFDPTTEADDRLMPHGGGLRYLTLIRNRIDPDGVGPLQPVPINDPDAYGVDLNGADGVRLVFVTIGPEHFIALGNSRGDSYHDDTTYPYDPVKDFYYDFGAIYGGSNVFMRAGVLMDRVEPGQPGHGLEWYGLIVGSGRGVGVHVNTGTLGTTTSPYPGGGLVGSDLAPSFAGCS